MLVRKEGLVLQRSLSLHTPQPANRVFTKLALARPSCQCTESVVSRSQAKVAGPLL
jgi:hypothetical protein